MVRTALISAMVALLLVAPGGIGRQALAADPSDSGPTTEAQPPPPENPPGGFGTFLSDNHEAFRTYGLIIGGVAGLIFAFWRARIATRQAEAASARADAAIDQARAANDQARAANEQARIAEQGHFTERFSRAAEHMGNPALPVRLGGIYALWRLAEDSSLRDAISVIDILCAFVRDPPHPPVDRPEPDTREGGPVAAKDEANATNKLRPDVQVILDLIGAFNPLSLRRLPDSHHLDFTGANLTGASLRGASLTFVNLTGANLTGANLTRANLTRAILVDADLTGATLTDANLAAANLTGANLTVANLRHASLAVANLTEADLTGAKFDGAMNIPDLSDACADPNNPPTSLPDDVMRPDPWEPHPEEKGL